MSEEKSNDITVGKVIGLIMAILTAMVGWHIHASVWWTIVDFLFWPIAIIKWLICGQLTAEIISKTFS